MILKRFFLVLLLLSLVLCTRGVMSADQNTESQQQKSLQTYVADLQRRINRAYFQPVSDASSDKETTVRFLLHKNGDVSKTEVMKSSTYPKFDENAVQAISNAAPMRPLPSSCQNDTYIECSFSASAVAVKISDRDK